MRKRAGWLTWLWRTQVAIFTVGVVYVAGSGPVAAPHHSTRHVTCSCRILKDGNRPGRLAGDVDESVVRMDGDAGWIGEFHVIYRTFVDAVQ